MSKPHQVMTRATLTRMEYRTLRIIALDEETTLPDLIGTILRDWLRARANKAALPVDKNDNHENS